jgi:Domain of unknown function (DUF1707)
VSEQREVRVSDGERQLAAERLRAAHDEGRLDLYEYDNRLVRAYSSVTYADLDALFADLPATATPATVRPAPPVHVPPRSSVLDDIVATDMHLALKILWTIWGGAVVINLTVWLLVSLGSGFTYFWPMWMAIPGVALLGATAGVAAIRTNRAERRRQLRQ